ncbi:hypothetical protein BN132_1002 [Cronobacter turicensis 564]|nr:hypothetical protein BN132_1002 [Cronobacter turicensis 564]
MVWHKGRQIVERVVPLFKLAVQGVALPVSSQWASGPQAIC